jgi:hypothetical protein
MPTVFAVGAYRIVVYPNDHQPPHVHAVGPGGEARFALGRRPADVRLMDAASTIPRAAMRAITAEVIDRHPECLAKWRKIHGDKAADR